MTNKPDSEYILGIDISRWDVIYNDYTKKITSIWNPDNATKRIDFVIQKCSDGKNPDKFVNELYEQTLKIPVRAAYHYFRSGLGWKVQLDAILSATKDKLYHFYAIDYEKFYNTLNATSFAEMMELMKQLKLATGKKVILYFNADIYQNNMKPYNADAVINSIDGCWFAQYPYKIFLDLNNLPTALPKNIKNLKFWQFAGDTFGTRGFGEGKDWGSPAKSMDINIWQGSLEELYIWAGVTNNPVPNPIPDPKPKPNPSRYTGNVLSTASDGLKIRNAPVSGDKIGLLQPNDYFEADTLTSGWFHITFPISGFISAMWTRYIDNDKITIPDPIPSPQSKPAIPGPFYLLSHRDVGEGWFWPNGKLDAYPAVVWTHGGNGNVHLSGDGQKDLSKSPTKGFMKSIRDIMNLSQWKRTWVSQEGWHNSGDVGTIRQVEFAHNKKWVTKINSDGLYEYDVYYNTDTPPNLNINYDKYRQGIMTVDYKTGHENTGGVIESDLRLPYISVANDRTEKLRIDPKYLKSLLSLPVTCKIKTDGSNVNIRQIPVNGNIVGSYKNGESVTILEVAKFEQFVWGRVGENKWIALFLTDLDI